MTLAVKFDRDAWDDYMFWQMADKATARRINELIRAAQREPFAGIGKPEALRHQLSGFWSRRITEEHRMVYRVRNDTLETAKLRYHYTL